MQVPAASAVGRQLAVGLQLEPGAGGVRAPGHTVFLPFGRVVRLREKIGSGENVAL
jgi:hypothetical protein